MIYFHVCCCTLADPAARHSGVAEAQRARPTLQAHFKPLLEPIIANIPLGKTSHAAKPKVSTQVKYTGTYMIQVNTPNIKISLFL